MWISLFSVTVSIALALALGAIVLESQKKAKPVRNLRHRL